MPDITMCQDSSCPKRETCYRFNATPTPGWQSYWSGSPRAGKRCQEYWPMGENAPQTGIRTQPIEIKSVEAPPEVLAELDELTVTGPIERIDTVIVPKAPMKKRHRAPTKRAYTEDTEILVD